MTPFFIPDYGEAIGFVLECHDVLEQVKFDARKSF